MKRGEWFTEVAKIWLHFTAKSVLQVQRPLSGSSYCLQTGYTLYRLWKTHLLPLAQQKAGSQSGLCVCTCVCVWMGSSASPPSSWATSLSSYQIFVCPSLFICLLFALFIEIYLRQIDNISRKFATYFLCLDFVCFCVQIIHIYRVLYLRLCSCLSDNDMGISPLLLFKFVKSQ